METEINVVYCAATSRILTFILQVLFNFFPDHQADAFRSGVIDDSSGLINSFIYNVLDGYHKWDAKYFVHIAKNGYQKEQYFAFFPMYPTLLNILSSPLPITKISSILLIGSLVNFFFFIGAALYLYKLTAIVYNKRLAWYSAIIFSLNPASIFFSALYTEAMYCFFSFAGMYYVMSKSKVRATIAFCLSAATRSNGVVNVGFIYYYELLKYVHHAFHERRSNSQKVWQLLKFIRNIFVCSITIVLPFISFNAYGYYKFCTNDSPNQKPWCNNTIIYSYVQVNHWNLGFLQYYQFQKIPNILLALPCILLTIMLTNKYITNNSIKYLELDRLKCIYCTTHRKNKSNFLNGNILAFMCHELFIVTFGLCYMHVEVITRMTLSSSPVLYWFMASTILYDTQNITSSTSFQGKFNGLTLLSKVILCYCLLYAIIGTFMHVNFLPWT